MSAQFAPAIATDGETLQKRAAFSHRALPVACGGDAYFRQCGRDWLHMWSNRCTFMVFWMSTAIRKPAASGSLLAKPGCVERDFEAALP